MRCHRCCGVAVVVVVVVVAVVVIEPPRASALYAVRSGHCVQAYIRIGVFIRKTPDGLPDEFGVVIDCAGGLCVAGWTERAIYIS